MVSEVHVTLLLPCLQKVLLEGTDPALTNGQCEQKGSLVDAEKLRFDFSWGGALTSAQKAQVESIVRERIAAGIPVYAEVVPLADATQINSVSDPFHVQ